MDILLVIGSCLLVIVFLLVQRLLAFKRFRDAVEKIPGPPISSIIQGNATDFTVLQQQGKNRIDIISEYRKQYGPVFRYWVGPSAWVIISKPEDIQAVLANKNQSFEDFNRTVLSLSVGRGLLVSKGELWNRQRKIMNPVFSVMNIKNMVPIMTEMVNKLIDKWNRNMKDGELVLDIKGDMRQLTLDIIGKCAFGIEFDFVNEKLMPKEQRDIFMKFMQGKDLEIHRMKMVVGALLEEYPWLTKIPFLAPYKMAHAIKKLRDDLDTISKRLIAERRNAQKPEYNLLSLLVSSKVDGEFMSDDQICDEMRAFLLAGHETTSSTLQWAFILLSRHPDVVEKILEEARTVLGDRDPTYDDISQLKYTSMVIYETLRIYPTIPFLGRLSCKPIVMGGYEIPAGCRMICSSVFTHNDKEVWSEPEKFNPMRWSERDSEANPYIFFPFSSGPRACIGKNFSLVESKAALVMILRRFKMELLEDKIRTLVVVTQTPASVKVRLTPLKC